MTLPDFAAPLGVFIVLAAFAAYGSRRAAQPADPLKPRLLPWRGLSLGAGVLAFFSLLLLMARLGFHAPR